MKHSELSNAELAFRLRKLGRHAPQWLAVVADRLEGMPADPVPVPDANAASAATDEEVGRDGGSSDAAPPPPDAADDLVRRYACFTFEDGVYEHPQGEHVAYADYAKQAAVIVALWGRLDAAYKGNAILLHEKQREWARAERAEAEAEVAAAHRRRNARELEADNAKLREALRELVEIKDLCVETGGVEMGREFRAWDAARAALEQP